MTFRQLRRRLLGYNLSLGSRRLSIVLCADLCRRESHDIYARLVHGGMT